MTEQCATVIGIALQVIGAAYLVYQSRATSRSLGGYKTTYENFSSQIERLSKELADQYAQQLVGFCFVLVGSGFQLYAALIA